MKDRMGPFLLQINFIIISTINFILRMAPFFLTRHVVLRIAGIKIGKGSSVHSKVRVFAFGKMIIGSNSTINRGCYLDNRRGIKIGDNVIIAHDTKIYTLGHDINDPLCQTKGSRVVVENYAIIFSNVLIMPGVTIGKGAAVYPGSVVTRDVAPYSVVGGNPAVIVGKRIKNLNYSASYKYWFAL
ncbi:MAG: acyltransferase [Dehalococcoidales bacterium]|jgi:maltose O-acetyltransferase